MAPLFHAAKTMFIDGGSATEEAQWMTRLNGRVEWRLGGVEVGRGKAKEET